MTQHHRREHREVRDEPPPVFSTWPKAYAFILVELAAVIGLLYWFTVALQP